MYKGVTIKRYNELAAAGYDEDFHKSPTGYESPPPATGRRMRQPKRP